MLSNLVFFGGLTVFILAAAYMCRIKLRSNAVRLVAAIGITAASGGVIVAFALWQAGRETAIIAQWCEDQGGAYLGHQRTSGRLGLLIGETFRVRMTKNDVLVRISGTIGGHLVGWLDARFIPE
ncbi:hypothetical protein LBMAG53_04940 [Planctomycetota bacterium]|nr:hypothetical protein LBMAG53_04940 [Planctomycetota bacterium]